MSKGRQIKALILTAFVLTCAGHSGESTREALAVKRTKVVLKQAAPNEFAAYQRGALAAL